MAKPATKDEIRRLNLSAVLTAVHHNGLISRANLGKSLGLSKTSIAELVEDLEALGLIVRTDGELTGSAGRPSQQVAPSSVPTILVVNPEIDGVNLGLVSFAAHIQHQEFVPMGKHYSFETMASLVADFFSRLTRDQRYAVHGVTLALPGGIDQNRRVLIDAPSLGWRNLDATTAIFESTKKPVWLINNARAGMLGEHRYGVAKGASNSVYLFSGVGGIGGGFIVDGRILTGANSLAGEIGKMRLLGLEPESRQTLGDALQRGPLALALTGGKSGSQITDAQLDDALSGMHSAEVNGILDSQIGALVSAIATLRDLFDPEKIILGGYLGSVLRVRRNEIEFLLDKESFGRKSRDFLVARPLEVKDMVLLGGAAEAWQSVLSNPQSIRKGATHA